MVRSTLRKCGLDLYRYRPDYHYITTLYGKSAYKQWDIREVDGFGPLAARVIGDGRTLLYYDRLYTLYQALQNVARLSAGGETVTIAESGVYRGGSSFFMALVAQTLGIEPSTLHAFDTFEGHHAADLGSDDIHVPTNFRDTGYEEVKRYLSAFPNVHVHRGRLQDNAHLVGDGPVHLVHLDMDIYEPTVFGLEFFDPRLADGGIIVVDDYGYLTCPGVKRAIDEFVEGRPNYSRIHLLTGQCVLVKNSAH